MFKQMTSDMDTPIDTVFNNVESLVDISTVDLNPYTNQQYINLVNKIVNKTG